MVISLQNTSNHSKSSMNKTHIFEQIVEATHQQSSWSDLGIYLDQSPKISIHIACMVEPFLSYIFNGRKTIESRFSKNLIQPYEAISVNDIVLLKSGPIIGAFCVSSVEFILLTQKERERLIKKSTALCVNSAFWEKQLDKHYATLIGISNVRQLSALHIDKHDRRGWVTLSNT